MNFRSNLANDRQPVPSFLSRHTEQEVRQARRWSNQIRKLMEQATALRMPFDRSPKVNVQVDGSVPNVLAEQIEQARRRSNSSNVEDLFGGYQVDDLMALLFPDQSSPTIHIANGRSTSTEHNDVLGAYLPEKPAIKLYWVVIGACAAALKCSVEDLTCVVLTHELAHAFTHLGQDLDGHYWDTTDFTTAEVTTIEGLAQFYTELTIKKMPRSSHSINDVFETLLQFQPEPYRKHREWIAQGGQNINEEIRRKMLACRELGTHGNLFDNV